MISVYDAANQQFDIGVRRWRIDVRGSRDASILTSATARLIITTGNRRRLYARESRTPATTLTQPSRVCVVWLSRHVLRILCIPPRRLPYFTLAHADTRIVSDSRF